MTAGIAIYGGYARYTVMVPAEDLTNGNGHVANPKPRPMNRSIEIPHQAILAALIAADRGRAEDDPTPVPTQRSAFSETGDGACYISCSHQPRVSTSAAAPSASNSAISSSASSMPRARINPSM